MGFKDKATTFVGSAAHKMAETVRMYGPSFVNGMILGLATYGASEITWSLIGGRKFEHDIHEHVGYMKGYEQGQHDAASLIGVANGSPNNTSNS
jgi:hypothetical protein